MKSTKSKNSSDASHVSSPALSVTEKDSFFSTAKQESNSLFGPHFIQPKLKISQPNDKYEQEANRVADAVMRMPDSQVQREPIRGDEERLQKKAEVNASGSGESFAGLDLSSQIKSKSGSGSSLPKNVQSEMGQKMGTDFSGVNIHTDSKSHQLNQQLGAKAFTHGRDVYFNKGEYNPASKIGKRLLAHELTHVVQQKKIDGKVTSYDLQRQLIDKSENRVIESVEDAEEKVKEKTVDLFISQAINNLNALRTIRIEALDDLEDELEEPDKPSVGEALLKEVLFATISYATMSLGGVLLRRILKKNNEKKFINDQLAKSIINDVRQSVESKMKDLVTKNFSESNTNSGRTPKEQFVEIQKHIVNDMVKVEQNELESKKLILQNSAKGDDQSKLIKETYDIPSKVAYNIQYLSGIGNWGKILSANNARNKTKSFNNRVGIWSNQGMLNITVSMQKPTGNEMKIVDASWPGLNDSTRSRLTGEFGNKRIRELHTNIRVKIIIEKSRFLAQSESFMLEYWSVPKGRNKVIMSSSGTPIYFLSRFSAGKNPLELTKKLSFLERQSKAQTGAYAFAGILMEKKLSELPLSN